MFENEWGEIIVDVFLACDMDATMKLVRGHFDSKIRSHGKTGLKPDPVDDAVMRFRPHCLAAVITDAR